MTTKEITVITDFTDLGLEIFRLLEDGSVEINSIKTLLRDKRKVEASEHKIAEVLRWLYVLEYIEFKGNFFTVPMPPHSPSNYFITVSIQKKKKSGDKSRKLSRFSTFLEIMNDRHHPKGAK